MSAPQLTVYQNAPLAVSGDQLNTFVQSCDNVTQMRALAGTGGMTIAARGAVSADDGLAGDFYWNSTATGPDDGVNVIVPTGSAQGAWVRLALPDVTTITNIASLRALAALWSQPLVYVTGYYSTGDGGEGYFWLNAADTTSADNGGTIIRDTAGRRWYRQGTLGFVTAKQFGARGVSTDDSAALANAVAWVNSVPGGILRMTAGNYVYTGAGLSLTTGTCVIGDGMNATTFTLANGASNGFIIGTVFTSVQFGNLVADMSIIGSGKTGGYAVSLGSAQNPTVQGLHVNNMPGGINCGFINNCTIKDSVIELQNASGYTAAVNWFAVADAAQVANVLIILNTTINCHLNGAGLLVDGACQTLRMQAVGIIGGTYGMRFRNTQASAQFWPGFIYCDDVEIDGVVNNAVLIEGGRNYHFTECDFFNNHGGTPTDSNTVQIMADGLHSVTGNIWLTGCRIAGANSAGVSSAAKNVYIADCYVGDNSVAGHGVSPAIVLQNEGGTNGAASGVTITGGNLGGAFGDLQNQSYGIAVVAGVTRVTVCAVDFTGCTVGAILDNTGTGLNVQWAACIDINGNSLANRITVLGADPAAPLDGMMWINEPSVALKVRIGSTTHTVTMS
jgi:hypothetical protein